MSAGEGDRTIAVTFIVIVATLFGQFALVRFWKEPYPAFVLPGGASVVRGDGPLKAGRYRLKAGDASRAYDVAPADLLADIPAQYRGRLLARCLGVEPCQDGKYEPPSPAAATEGKAWLKARLEALQPGAPAAWLEIERVDIIVEPGVGEAGERVVWTQRLELTEGS